MTEPLGADYKLRVVYNDGATEIASDASDAFLSIVAPTLRVIAPNGGESLIFGAETQATWTVDNATLSVGSFDLEAVSPTKGTYTLNASPIAVDPAKTDYSFAWTVAQPLGSDYKLHVIYRDGAAQQRATDDSDAYFTIVHPAHRRPRRR